jgi:cysteine-rich repeat protein
MYPSHRLTTKAWLVLAVFGAGSAVACDDGPQQDEPGGIVIYDAGPGGAPDGAIRPNRPVMTGEIAPVYGFVSKTAKTEYYYLGEVDKDQSGKVPVNPIYFFYDEQGQPLFRLSDDGTKLVGWHPVVDLVPTKKGYSPYWQVYHVRVKGTVTTAALTALRKDPEPEKNCQMDAVCPEGKRCTEERCVDPITIGRFDLDGIKSKESLDASKLVIQKSKTIINCPIVNADAKLLQGLSRPDLPFPRVQVWYQRLKAFCYLVEGGKALLQEKGEEYRWNGATTLRADQAPAVSEAYFLRQELTFNSSENKALVSPGRHLVLTEHLPGGASYSPLVKENTIIVGAKHKFMDLRSVAEAKSAGLKFSTGKQLHNLVVRGPLPYCEKDKDCAGTGGRDGKDLICPVGQFYCAAPYARLHEECRRGVKECDPKGGSEGKPLVCVGFRVREKYFCYNSCEPYDDKDTNTHDKKDSRCGNIYGARCYSLPPSPIRPDGVCILNCNSRAGNTKALLDECKNFGCGNGKLDYGATSDDGNTNPGDGCNEHCTPSTYTRCESNAECKGAGQTCSVLPGTDPLTQNTYCTPLTAEEKKEEKDEDEDDGKNRLICMQYDYCVAPDERADWLQKEATK